MVAENGRISRSHGIGIDVLRMQAQAMSLPIVQVRSSWETYEAEFKKTLSGLKCEGVDISGEGGEYHHTFVVSGPIFKKRINILKSEKITRDQHCFLDILECELTEK